MKSKNSKLQYMPSLIFCLAILIVPVLYFAIADSDYSTLEKRKLSQMPEPTVESVFSGKFGKDFETYLNDQMPLRTFFVGTNAYYDLLSGRNGMGGIYSGSDDYLLVSPVRESSVFSNNLDYIEEFLETTDVPSYVCVVPSSGYICGDKLPLNHKQYDDEEIISKAEAAFSNDTNTTCVSISERFKELASSGEQLYYKTDHHWTSQGAYECYQILGGAMGFTPTPKSSFTIEKYDGFYGTNYSKAALWFKPGETLELWDNQTRPNGAVEMIVTENGEVTYSDSLFYRENLKTTDQYTAFLDGNHAMVTIRNSSAQNNKTLLILRDSYCHCLAPFLADNYSEIILLDVRYYLFPVSDVVKNENVDEILLLYSIDSLVNSTDLAGIY